MKTILKLFLFSAILSVAACATPSATLRSVGYIPSWKGEFYDNLDWSALTHINVAFCNPNTDGVMQNPFRNDPEAFVRLVQKAHENDVLVIASLGGGGGGKNYPALLATPESRTRFCENIMEYVRKYDLDGVDLDLEEEEGHVLWTVYEPWVVELEKFCEREGVLLTTAVSTWFSDEITDRTFACFDFINIMAYDGPFDGHSTMGLARTMARSYRKRGIPRDEIVIGVPFYGRLEGGTWSDNMGYNEILAEFPGVEKGDYVGKWGFNGMRTMKKKVRLGRHYGGIMIWELSHDTEDERSLLKVVKDNLWR